jgi:hypothetical protein
MKRPEVLPQIPPPLALPCTGGLGGLFRCSLLIRDFKHNSNRIADALSFYLDNQEEINHYIEQNRIPEELLKPQRARTLALQRFKDLKI